MSPLYINGKKCGNPEKGNSAKEYLPFIKIDNRLEDIEPSGRPWLPEHIIATLDTVLDIHVERHGIQILLRESPPRQGMFVDIYPQEGTYIDKIVVNREQKHRLWDTKLLGSESTLNCVKVRADYDGPNEFTVHYRPN